LQLSFRRLFFGFVALFLPFAYFVWSQETVKHSFIFENWQQLSCPLWLFVRFVAIHSRTTNGHKVHKNPQQAL